MYEQARSLVQQVQQYIAETETKPEQPKTDPLRDYVYIDWAAVARVPQTGSAQEMNRSYMHEIPDESDDGGRSRTTSGSSQISEAEKVVDKNNNVPAKQLVVEDNSWDSDREDEEYEFIQEHNQIINAWQFDPAFSKYD